MKRIFKYIIFALIGVLFIGTFVFLFKNSRPQPELFMEHEARIGSVSRTTVITGKIEPRNEGNIKPQIHIEIGGPVRKLVKIPFPCVGVVLDVYGP